MAIPLESEFQYYLEHQEELVAQHDGKYVVISGTEVIGFYENELEAIQDAQSKNHKPGSFLVQLISPGEDSYTQTFHSRVAFSWPNYLLATVSPLLAALAF